MWVDMIAEDLLAAIRDKGDIIHLIQIQFKELYLFPRHVEQLNADTEHDN